VTPYEQIAIAPVVGIASLLVVAIVLLTINARRHAKDADARAGLTWLVFAGVALFIGTSAMLGRPVLQFWVTAVLIGAAAHVTILCGFGALSRGLGHRPPLALLTGVAVFAVGLQIVLALAEVETVIILAVNSIVNATVVAVMTVTLWRQSRPMGRPQVMLATLPFALILGLYLLRLVVVLLGTNESALTIVTLALAFLLTFAILQWCFSLMAFSTVRLTRSLFAERRRAEEANRMKSQFLANMSHEVRTPLNGVLGMAQILERRITEPADREMIMTIRQSGEELLNILNDILDLSKVEAGKMELDLAPFRPADVITRLERLYRARAQDKGIALIVDRGPGLDALCLGDSHRIIQILHNLLSNAVKFTESGTVRVEARWLSGSRSSAGPERTPASRIGQGRLEVVVADSGIGMTPDQMGRIFEDFVQADGGITRRFGGTGLGLAIARRIVDLMGGRITVESWPNRGTRFQVLLPLAEASVPHVMGSQQTPHELERPTGQEGVPAPTEGIPDLGLNPQAVEPIAASVAAEPRPPVFSRSPDAASSVSRAGSGQEVRLPRPDPVLQGVRILMAEDNLTNQRVVSAMLAGTGAELSIVGNGLEAVHRVIGAQSDADPRFDLLLLDVSMPEMDGPTALRTLRAHATSRGYPAPRAIALTANVMAHQVAAYRIDGFVDYLGKPLRRADLIGMIRRHARSGTDMRPDPAGPVASPSAALGPVSAHILVAEREGG
jgi:signal transduction histidine kinase/DNA-binding NarL/FixJ family response regulator